MPGDSVLVIGDVMTDIIVRTDQPMTKGADTWAAIASMPGGSGANQAAWLGALGAKAILAARVNAADRDAVAAELAGWGVEPALAVDADHPSGRLITFVGQDGERSFLSDRGANRWLERGDLPDALLDRAALVHVTGYTFLVPQTRSAVLDFLGQAKRRGIPVTVDPGSTTFLRDLGALAFLSWTEGMTACFPNEDEAETLTGSSDRARQMDTLTRRYEFVVIKRGAQGADAGNAAGERWSAPAVPAEVVDTTGAGDAFLAGYLSAHLQGRPVTDCLALGVECGARAASIVGGRPPKPKPPEPEPEPEPQTAPAATPAAT